MLKILFSIITLICITIPVMADTTPTKHNCTKPTHPGSLASDVRMKGFQQEVNNYRECISKFADEQKKQIKLHEDAGNAAVEEFNTFAKNELNPKKEDEGTAK
jgi:hypothetical protein